MADKGPRLVFLWTVPRSCSSAFERSIMTLPDIRCPMTEPFAIAYYLGPQRQSQRYESQEIDQNGSYETLAKSILDQSTGDGFELVFIKDMAFYMKGRFGILKDFFRDAKHSFLIRDPTKAISSMYRASENPEIQASGLYDYFDARESGFQELYEMYAFVKDNFDPNPVVIDADDLLTSPKQIMKAYCHGVGITFEDHMTSWKAGEVPQPWQGRFWLPVFRRRAINSSRFVKAGTAGSSSEAEMLYPNDVIKAIDESRPFYEKLYSARIMVSTEKGISASAQP